MNKKSSRVAVKKDEKEPKQYVDDPDCTKVEVTTTIIIDQCRTYIS